MQAASQPAVTARTLAPFLPLLPCCPSFTNISGDAVYLHCGLNQASRRALAWQRCAIDGALRVVDIEGTAARRQRLKHVTEGVPASGGGVEWQGYYSAHQQPAASGSARHSPGARRATLAAPPARGRRAQRRRRQQRVVVLRCTHRWKQGAHAPHPTRRPPLSLSLSLSRWCSLRGQP